jgi:hypothetical protein
MPSAIDDRRETSMSMNDEHVEENAELRAAPQPSKPPAAFATIQVAARRLSVDAAALRARCRRAARREGDAIVARLGGGIVAFKFGRTWRVHFPAP